MTINFGFDVDVEKDLMSKSFQKYPELSSTEYAEVANLVGWSLVNGVPVTEEEVQSFVYIQLHATPLGISDDQLEYNMKEIDEALKQRAQMQGGPLPEQAWLQESWSEQDVTVSDETFNSIIGGVFGSVGMAAARQLAYRTATGYAAAARGTLDQFAFHTPSKGALASLASRAGGGIVNHIKAHPIRAGLTGLGVATIPAFALGEASTYDLTGAYSEVPVGEEDTALTEAPPLQFIDTTGYYTGTPGAVVEIPAEEAASMGVGGSQPDPVNGGVDYADLDPALAAMAQTWGIDPSLLMGSQDQVSFNPLIAGDINLPYQTFEYGIDLSGQPLTQPPAFPGAQTPPLGGYWEDPWGRVLENQDELQQEYLEGLNVSPGGQVMPNAFREWTNGQTLLEIAAQAAADFGVPIDVLYGLVTQESGWNPYAVGDSGNSHGLVQIFGPAHPGITTEQAQNPVFALRWAANNLLSNYQRYGSWELAVIAHRSPAGARHLAENNEFLSELDRAYIANIAAYAMQSTLGNTIFGGAGSALAEAGLSSTGPAAPPMVKPDRATLAEFVEGSYADVYGREATPEEMEGRIDELEGLYKKAYRQSIRNFRGQTSTAVSPEDQFIRGLKESGEGQHRKAADRRNSMHQYMGNVAAILSGGI